MLDSLKYCAPTLIFSGFFGLPHICDPPAAAVAESVYPVEQEEQSTPATSQRVPADPVATVGVPFEQVQVLAEHFTTLLKRPFVPHVAVVLREYTYPHVATLLDGVQGLQ